jgi:tryptophan-rich sensory protein
MKLFASLFITLAIAVITGFVTAPQISTWYALLHKPSINPPNWVFMPVWIVLYILMSIALYLVWKRPKTNNRNIAIAVFFVQLALNCLWSFIFFAFHLTGLALVEIMLLWFAILLNIILFAYYSKAAAWLLAPYIVWVSFAGILNYLIWHLNV